MKKLLSVLLAVVIAACACTALAVPAMAYSVNSPGGRTVHVGNDPLVNNRKSNQVNPVVVATDDYQSTITFTYKGDGDLKGWQIIDKNGNAVAVGNNDPSYRIVSQDGNSITIEILDWDKWESPDGYTINAVVENEGTSDNGDKDSGSTSPKTGVASVAFASMAAAGAGVAILGLTKKRDAE